MEITRDQLLKILRWEPVCDEFGRGESTFQLHIAPPLRQLTDSGLWKVRVLADGGMENYYAYTVRSADDPSPSIHNSYPRTMGIVAYLSLLGPFAAAAWGEVAAGSEVMDVVADQAMRPENIIVPGMESSALQNAFFAAFANSAYQFLSADELDDVNVWGSEIDEVDDPHVFRFSSARWGEKEDRVFHVLFHHAD